MADVRIDLDHGGIAELLKSPEVAADLGRRGRQVAAAAGPGHEVETYVGRTRVRVTVRTATVEARRAEASRRSLTLAFEAARG